MTRPDDMRLDATPYYASLYEEAMEEAARQPQKCWVCEGEKGGYVEDEFSCGESVWVRCAACNGTGYELDDMDQARG